MLHREHELHRRRRARNIAVLAALGGFAALLFVVTIVKMGANAGNPWG
jgi:ferric-dicitrate binding protein FerR (iron transport regulator)